jgi:hypothetical protein
MTDSLKVYDILKEAHIPDGQARAITQAIRDSQTAIALDVRSVLDDRLQHVAAKTDLADLKAELTRWMFTFWVGQTAATIAIVKLWR